MSDIVERLRWWGAKKRAPKNMPTLPADCADGAEEITRLRSELANARNAAIEEAASLVDDMVDEDSYPLPNRHLISRAIRALKAEGESR